MIYHIFTDASVNNETLNAGYAFIIVTKKGEVKRRSGKLTTKTDNSCLAEFHSIANALYSFGKIEINTINRIVIHTDCMNFVQYHNGFKASIKSRQTMEAAEQIILSMIEICIKFGVDIRNYKNLFHVKHIKSHTGARTALQRLNDWCDKEAVRQRKLLDNEKRI